MSSPVGSVGSRPQTPVASAPQNVAPRPQPAAEEAKPAEQMEAKQEASGGLDVSA